jgi:hypothetical protein
MSNELIGLSANYRSIVFPSRDVVPCYAGVDFIGRFGRCDGAEVDDCAYEAGRVLDAGYVGADELIRHVE